MKPEKIIFYITKQILLSPFMWIILILLPIIIFSIKTVHIGSNNEEITAAFYINSDLNNNIQNKSDSKKYTSFYSYSELSAETENLINKISEYDGLYKFKKANSKEEVIKMVKKGEVSCGYIFDDAFLTKMLNMDTKNTINVLSSNNSSLSPLLNETLYSIIYGELARLKAAEYILTKDSIKEISDNRTIKADDIFNTYENIEKANNVFNFNYNGEPTNYKPTSTEILLTPLRGIISLFILISGFSGAVYYYKDKSNLLFKNKLFRISYIFVPAYLTAIFSLLCIIIAGKNELFIKEFLVITLYTLIITFYVYIFSLIIKNSTAFYAILPFLILCCFVFTPIIFDISSILQFLKPVTYFFPTKYYLIFF